MERKQVWFTLPVEYSPDCGSQSSDSQASGDFKTLQASLDSDHESFGVPKTTQPDLSQYTLRPSMDNNTTNETYSTNDSQDISTSQQESNSEGQYGYDEGNSTGSLHDSPHSEAVSTAIMEVSGELILGKFTPQKPHSCGGSESSDISDDDHRRPGSGGAIAKYPESSTGLSDNDWNPYATESDTNQTPRSPRSNGSDDQSRGGYVSKATINIGGLDKIKSEPTTTVSMRTGQVTYGEGSLKKDTDDKPESTRERTRDNHGDKMDILRYVVDESKDNDMSKERNEKVERSQESRLSADSGADTLRRESSESGRSFDTAGTLVSDVLSGRPSSELDRGEVYVSDVRDSVDSARSDGLGPPSGRQSLESGRSESARQSVDTQKSGQSDRSRASDQSQKSVAASAGSDRSERLDRLSDAAGDNLKEIMQFESAQRGQSSDPEESKNKSEPTSSDEAKIVCEPSPVSRTRLTARLEPYVSPKRSDRSPERSPKVAATSKERYMSVAERERLLSESPEFERLLPKSVQQERLERETFRRSGDNDSGASRPAYSSTRLGDLSDNLVDRSPSQVSMQRVSSLFEETKRQAREAVAFQRPDPSGSEERFPLKERLTISKHDDSFKAQDKSGASDGRLEKSRESDTARSLNSEEVARVLARFSDERAVTNVSVKSAESDVDNAVMVSAFDRVNNESGASGGEYGRRSAGDASRTSTESEDEIARRVRSILAQTDHFTGQSKPQGATEYVPRTMDYSRLQRDLQEIQDNLPDAPPPRANDSIHLQRKLRVDPGAEGTEGSERSPREEYMKSLESTATTMGRESGVSEYGRRLVWDHGADLEYTDGYGGQFLGTRGSSDTLSTRLRASGETDTLTATTGRSRPDSAATVDTDGEDFQGTRTLTGSDIARAEKIVDQVMNRRAEGDLKESVEDIIARYRNERQDLFQRHQAPPEPLPPPQVRQTQSMPESSSRLPSKFLADTDSVPVPRKTAPVLTNPDVALSGMNASGDAGTAANGKRKEVGLAERVYRILQDEPELSDNPDEKGMAKKVYKILASERPHDQVNGILTDTMTEEHELLKKLVSKPKDDSSLDDSGLNVSSESFNLEDKDVRKQLDYSTFSSPGKGDKSDFARLREVTSAPYSALSNARSLLSNQLQKMSERNFDKSVELRTPFRQRIQCYPVYGAERQTGSPTSRGNAEEEVREAWMPVRRSAQSTTSITQANRDRALDNERFFLTERDRNLEPGDLEPQTRPRTYSDPFDSPSRYARGRHTRSKSEEAANQSDVSQHSFVDAALSPTDRRPAQSPRRLGIEHATPKEHRPKDYRGDGSPSPTESDTSSSRKGARFRPYRPAGSRDMYYTESGDETNESATTIESTHPGSDDAAPPYIPSQFLGSRRDEPQKHPTGIYGKKEKDALSTIDEQSVKDDREKALSASTGSGKDSRSGADDLVARRPTDNDDDKRSSIRTVDTGYHSTRSGPVTDLDPRPPPSRTADPPELSQASRASGPGIRGSGSGSSLENELVQRRSTSPKARTDGSSTETQYGVGASARGAASLGSVERPGFKTREQFQRDFERRERELKDILSQRSNKDSGINERDSLGASTRSDPGGMLTDDAGPRWEYRDSDHPPREFLAMDPEPAYPQERLRHSRSRSDTDLAGLSPSESQRYSSPMQPGTRFLELSTQPSPIFNHQDSYTHASRGAPRDRAPAELPRVPLEKEMPRGAPPAKELPRVPLDMELPRGVPQGQGKQPGELPRVDPEREYRQPHPAPELPKNTEKRPSSPAREFPVRALEPGDLGPVELGVDPRRIPSHMRNQGSRAYSQARSTSPVYPRQKEMEVELEKLNKQLSDQVNELQGGRKLDGPEEFVDQFPPSKKAQVLRQVLEQEYVDNLPPNINDMWARFKEQKEQSMSESSLDSQRLNALSGLLENPTHHTVNSFVQERTEEAERRKREDRERLERMKEEEKRVKDNERRLAAERAAVERTRRREELKQRRGLSEEESNGSYSEILMEEERKRERRLREAKKEEKRERRKSPSKKASPKSTGRNKEQEEKGRTNGEQERRKGEKAKSKGTETDIRARKMEKWHSDSMDTLFSIPEDASFEQSPTKAESDMKTRQRRHRHVIDPLMSKLRDKIKLQRVKIDKERRKELKRVDKLKKLEMLLTAKRKGQLSDKAIGVELEDVSSTSTCLSQTESSQNSDSTLTALSVTDSTLTSDHSTTMKDSSIENRIKLQVKKYPDDEFYKSPQKHYSETDSAESSDFNNILVERLKEKSETQKPKEKKSSKGKKYKVDEFGNKIRKERKDRKKKAVFDVEVSEDDLQNQLQRYEEYMTPDRGRRLRDASTMYPSPITVSPPSRRRMREVLMKSEAIQTSPSVRSTSPTYAYDEVPVASVPYMSNKKGGKSSRTSRRRPSPSPDRSTQSTSISPPRRTSRSPVTRATRKSSLSPVTRASKKSRSPVTKTTRKSSASPVNRPTSGSPARRRFSPPITRRQAKSPIWRPESEDRDLPYHGMFTPEYADENSAPKQQSKPAETWFISMSKSDKPWRQPLKERQANAIRKEAWQPTSISQSNWRNIVNNEPVRDKGGDPSDVSRDTKFDLDPEGQPLGEGSDSEESTIDLDKPKPLSKMTLQEAFQYRKNHVISRLRERQKRLNLAAEQRRMEAYLKMERDRLFQEEKRKEANPDAHPYSEHLYKPARRIISKEEMKELTQKKYKKLPEVLQQQKLKKRQEDYSLNRIKARLFNRKVQKKVLIQANKWGS